MGCARKGSLIWRMTWAVLAVLGWSTEAMACGGCFSPPQGTEETSSFVTAHRMAFSMSVERTVLWDQFSYTGEPEDFSWVLPVKPGAYLEEAHPAFLDALDQFTTPQVFGPQIFCGQEQSGCSCGLPGGQASSAEGDGGGGRFSPPVTVVSQETVGPYDTVVLRSTDDRALTRWLTANGYVVPQNIQPVIDQYVKEGFDFLALRLSPGKSVNQMTPVRVITPEGDPQLPLRMVAAGVGSNVEITLFILANSRQVIPDLLDAAIDPSQIIWNHGTETSNYDIS